MGFKRLTSVQIPLDIHAVIIQILKTGAMRARHQTTNLSISDAAVTSSEPQSACVKVGTHSGFFFFLSPSL